MPTYSIKAPDGKTYKIDGPAGATDDDVRAEVIRQHPHLGESPQPITTSDESITKPRDYAAVDVPLEALLNSPSSAAKMIKNTGHFVAGVVSSALPAPVQYLIGKTDTGKDLLRVVPDTVKTGTGAVINAGTATAGMMPGVDRESLNNAISNKSDALKGAIDAANQAGGALKARYGGWDELKRTLAEDPVGAAADIYTLARGGAGLARKAGAGPMMDAAANSRVGQAVSNAVNKTGGVAGNIVKYPVNKLVDVTGWTLDSLMGRRVPVTVGNKLRESVVEPNMNPEAKAAAVQNAINVMKDRPDVSAGQALADAGIKAPTMQALQQIADKKLDITSSQRADSQIASRQRMMDENTPDRVTAEAERKSAVDPLYDEVTKAQVEAPLSFQQLIDKLPGNLERKTALLTHLEENPPLLQKGSPATRSMTTDPYTGAPKVVETPATPAIASGAGTKALIDYVKREKAQAFKSGDTNLGHAYDEWLGKFQQVAHEIIPGLKEADALYAIKSVPVNQAAVMTELNRVRTDPLLPDTADKARAFSSELEKANSDITQGRSVNALREVNAPEAMMNKPLNVLSADQRSAINEVNRQGQRDAQMKIEAAKGSTNAAKIMDEDTLRLDGGISVPMIVLRKVIKTVGNHLSDKAQMVMAEAMQSGKSTAEAMQALPASDRMIVLKAVKDAKLKSGELLIPGAIGNNSAPIQENKNALTK